MIPAEVIKLKRNGNELSSDVIKEFVDAYVAGRVADYQMAAFLMAVFFQGMSKKETWSLTEAMLRSGDVMDFSDLPTVKVDKHSTGGVGDKTSLILGPIAAAAGVSVPMISGRGLGRTGGTLDKLESIPGFRTQLSSDEFKSQVKRLGVSFIGQTAQICPADKRMYALRDVTGTVECIPLICASIMSKKLAEGIDALVLDVKTGSGAFMKTLGDSKKLVKGLIGIGEASGKKVSALITDMNQPLGRAIGNALEVRECLDVLKNQGPEDLTELSLTLSAHMILLGRKARNLKEARAKADEILKSGAALKRFEEVVQAQGGRLSELPRAEKTKELKAEKRGYVTSMDVEKIGMASLSLGAGRLRHEDAIDPSTGIFLHRKKIGEPVTKGESLATLHFNGDKDTSEAEKMLKDALQIRLQKVKAPRLIKALLTSRTTR